MAVEDDEYSDEFLLGITTKDRRLQPRDLHENFDVDAYIRRNYGQTTLETSIPTLEEREINARRKLMGRQRTAGIPAPKAPMKPSTLTTLYTRQQFVESKKGQYEYARTNNLNKRASTLEMQEQDLDIGSKTIKVYKLTDPYDQIRKFLFEDCFRSDPVAKRCILSQVDLVMGTRAFAVLDIDKEFTTEEIADGTKRAEMEKALSGQEMSAVRTELNEIDKEVKMRSKMCAAMVQSSVGGRAVLEKVSMDRDGIPTDLKILNWKKLGDIYIDADTWKIAAIDYADRPENEPLLPEQIIYHSWNDFHVTPDSLWYGLSDMEGIASTSEINRLLDEIDLKETARTQWSKTGQVIFPPDTAPEVIRKHMATLVPGTMNGTDLQVKFDLWDLESNLERMLMLREQNDRRIIRNFGNPMVTVGFEEITNHATVDKVFTFHEQTTVKARRTWLQDIYEPQWYAPILKQLVPGLVKPLNSETPGIKSMSAETLLRSAAVRDPDSDVGKQQQVFRGKFATVQRRQAERKARRPTIKVKLEFESVSIESLKDKMPILLQMHQAHLITTKGLLKQANMPQEIEEVEKLEKEFKEEEEKKYSDEMKLNEKQIEVGQRKTQMMEKRQQAALQKRASVGDALASRLLQENIIGQQQIAFGNQKQAEELEYIRMKKGAVKNIDAIIAQRIKKGGLDLSQLAT